MEFVNSTSSVSTSHNFIPPDEKSREELKYDNNLEALQESVITSVFNLRNYASQLELEHRTTKKSKEINDAAKNGDMFLLEGTQTQVVESFEQRLCKVEECFVQTFNHFDRLSTDSFRARMKAEELELRVQELETSNKRLDQTILRFDVLAIKLATLEDKVISMRGDLDRDRYDIVTHEGMLETLMEPYQETEEGFGSNDEGQTYVAPGHDDE